MCRHCMLGLWNLVTRRTGVRSWSNSWTWCSQKDRWQNMRLCGFGDGFSSLLEMFWEGLQSAHWQPFRTMPTPPEVAHFQVMQSWLSVCTEPCLVLAANVNSNLLQQNHGSSRQTLVMMLMVAVLQRVLVQCSSFQQGNQFFSSHKGVWCLMLMLSVFNPAGKQTAIFKCEFFALFCAFLLWGDRVTNAVVIYTDNNGVRDSLISCVSRNVTAKKILVATMALECTKQLTPWYARIPPDSNLSDGPSRLNCQKVLDHGRKGMQAWSLSQLGWTRGTLWKLGGTAGHRTPPALKKLASWAQQFLTQFCQVHVRSVTSVDSAIICVGSAGAVKVIM